MTVPARIELPVRVRFDECGADGLVRDAVLVRYAQDVAWAHSESAGFDRAWYAEHGLTWLVRCLGLEVVGMVGAGAAVHVSTEVTGWRRVWARRRSEITAADGAPVALATTDWVLLGASGAPVRVPTVILDAFATRLPAFEPAHLRLAPTPPDATADRLVVRPHELDPLGHANHAVYVDWVEEAVRGAGGEIDLAAVPRRLHLEFIRSAQAGAIVERAVWRADDGGWACRLTAGSDELLRAELRSGAWPGRGGAESAPYGEGPSARRPRGASSARTGEERPRIGPPKA